MDNSILKDFNHPHPDALARKVLLNIPDGFHLSHAEWEAQDSHYATVTAQNVRDIYSERTRYEYDPRVMGALLESKINEILGKP